jgi:hypothetical protein
MVSSDARIKEDIQDINDDSALQMILAIKPKTYKYIDKIEKGDDKVYGFIAQQIREVIPEEVTIQKSYIPNIMLFVEVLEVIDELTFKIKELETEYSDNKIFRYIFTLNVCATQELHRKILSQEAHIKELETKMEQILKYISI